MKNAIIIILAAITTCNTVIAQSKDNLYAGLSLNFLGASVTYDRKLTKHLDAGIGANIYNDAYEQYNNIRSAIYLDLRPYIRKRKHLFFFPIDGGIGLFTGAKPKTYNMSGSGVYGAFGFGYARLINKMGMGPYITITMQGADARYQDYNLAVKPRDYTLLNADLYISLGFKF